MLSSASQTRRVAGSGRIVLFGVLLWLLVMTVVGAGAWFFQVSGERDLLALLYTNQRNTIHEAQVLLRERLYHTQEDLRFLAHAKALRAALVDQEQADQDLIASTFRDFAQTRGNLYSQLRFINLRGREVVRVDSYGGVARIVPDSALQDKSSRYYFSPSLELEEDAFYLSRLDLNVEFGEIETPIQPTLRISTPAFDSQGRRVGFFIINICGASLLDQVRGIAAHHDMALWMANEDGEWMVGPEPSLEWAHQLGRSMDGGVAARYPGPWAARHDTGCRDAILQQADGEGGGAQPVRCRSAHLQSDQSV